MIDVTIFEEAMCCPTGVCGPDPDEELVRITRTVDRLEEEYDELDVTRASLAHDVGVFLENERIYDTVQEKGPEVLPVITVDDEIVAEGAYLTYDEFDDEISRRLTRTA
ncbi:arsenical resistance operon trans-acting repressor ArsD [Halalkaliarchaeum desulfuricum]|uniref:Arsenical resistance operon trans-acting repressor ArsD n=1 Tax=Halalkaliarchaeum desulfuricum TaxID=2055893 RepID=A0A343TG58_9EURY|nr:arsenite efflux transporter metallochaperone ArsD [Halalkaliarchaeum desulfuricum]AUX08080.1 arsenical resistance operon trans-acting repressor ArsD [Halalkaliarchaeum desulfuricum]